MDKYGEKHLVQHILDSGWGFVVRNDEGGYLTQYLFWYPHEMPEEAYVHSIVSFDCENWDIHPHELIPAKYENEVVTILGEPIPYSHQNAGDSKTRA